MTKLYAIVKPAYTFLGQGLINMSHLMDLPYFVLTPVHRLLYENICGYSLGHDVEFFDTLEEAKDEFERAVKTNREYIYGSVVQNAIIELDHDKKSITELSNIYTVRDIKQLSYPSKNNNRFFVVQCIPCWEKRAIKPEEISPNALTELSRQYKARIEHGDEQSSEIVPNLN